MLERQLEMTRGSRGARGACSRDLARTAWEGFADGAGAQRYLDEALALVPDHLPAVLAIADIYYKEGQWELAEKRLTEAVRRLRDQPQQAARLYQRLAEVHEKLGKLDEAYRQLVEADRMGPGQLLTKLSLGENRFRAGRGARRPCTWQRWPITPTPPCTPRRSPTPWRTPRRPRSSCAARNAPSRFTRRR